MKRKIYIILGILFMLGYSSCKKDDTVNFEPVPSPFSAQAEAGSNLSSQGGTVSITIKAGTTGWWVEIPADAPWCSVAKKYGSGDFSLPVTIQGNKTGSDRNTTLILHPTFNQQTITINITQTK